MKFGKWMLAGMLTAALTGMATQAQAGTILVGFEDTVGGDYDYNDLVLSLTGLNLSLNTATGAWFAKPATLNGAGSPIGQTGTPYWNNASSDGLNDNVGFCIYGGPNAATCGGAGTTGLSSKASYLAANKNSTTGSANDVTFSVTGGITTVVSINITAATDSIGWYDTLTPGTVNVLNGGSTKTGTFFFTPTAGHSFGLVGINGSSGQSYYSNLAAGGVQDNVSHFAYFLAAPEPSTMLLFGSALVGLGAFRRSRRKA